MNRRVFTILAVVLVLALALGGCGKKAGVTVGPSGAQAAIRERIAIDTGSDCYLHSGADLVGYSDGHTTETYRLDSAAGNLTLDGSITASTYISMAGWTFTDPSTISNTLEVTDRVTAAGLTSSAIITGTDAVFSGLVTAAALATDSATVTGVTLSPSSVVTVTSAAFSMVASFQRIASASWVTPTINVTGGGTVFVLVNAGTENITLSDTGHAKLAGELVLGAGDTVTLVSDGTDWYELSRSNN